MAGGKTPKPKAKAKPSALAAEAPVRRSLVSRVFGSLWRPMPLLVTSLLLAGTMFWPQIVQQLPDLSRRPEYQLAWSDVQLPPPGKWVPAEFVAQVRVHSELPEELSLLDDGLVKQLATAFAQHPWVASVESVVKRPHGVQVKLTYREPALMVQTNRGLYPVDREGVLLPPGHFSAADVQSFPVVEQVRSMPAGPAGTSWGDTAVIGAARLAVRLTQSPTADESPPWERYGLKSMVVLPQQGPVAAVEDVIYGLTTRSGSRIIWGHAPGTDALEPTVEQKLERLDKFLADNGSFEPLDQPVRIDITDWEVIRWEVLSRFDDERVLR